MKILSLLATCLVSVLSGCNPSTNVLHKIPKKSALTPEVEVSSFYFQDNVYKLKYTGLNSKSAQYSENNYNSMTFVGQNWSYTYSVYRNGYDNLVNFIQNNTGQYLLHEYFFGFRDQRIVDTINHKLFFTREYFVNPYRFGQGSFWLEDKTWHNFYDSTPNDYFGCWKYDTFASYDVNSFSIDDYYEDEDIYQIDLLIENTYITGLYECDYLGSIEPQRHYSNTYTVIGNNDGQYFNNILSFVPYFYVLVNRTGDTWGDFLGITNEVYIEYNLPSTGAVAYNNAYNDGFRDGTNTGYQDGYDAGSDVGYIEGYDDGVVAGTQQGYSEGFSDGNSQGYITGYNAGAESAHNYTFTSLFTSIADTPVLVFRNLFNFDLFGINALVVVMSLFTALVLIFIAKKLLR